MSQRERPILFSGPMVRAILEGRKTQTRRIAKVHDAHIPGQISPDGSNCARSPQEHIAYCPYGKAGDHLWVRETFIYIPPTYCYEASASIPCEQEQIHYRADEGEYGYGPWKPSIFMPRRLSRITLEIENVRIEKLQAISGHDIGSEGIEMVGNYRAHFRDLWDKINAKRGFGWDVNPWVWVIEFNRVAGGAGARGRQGDTK